MKRTNIMLGEDQHRKLKAYARQDGRTIGRLVREAVDGTYGQKDPLNVRKNVALQAYQEGLISLGKLAEVLGVDPLAVRDYLKGLGIPLLGQDLQELSRDAANA